MTKDQKEINTELKISGIGLTIAIASGGILLIDFVMGRFRFPFVIGLVIGIVWFMGFCYLNQKRHPTEMGDYDPVKHKDYILCTKCRKTAINPKLGRSICSDCL